MGTGTLLQMGQSYDPATDPIERLKSSSDASSDPLLVRRAVSGKGDKSIASRRFGSRS